MASNTFDINLVVLKIIFALFYIDFRFIFVMFPQLCQNLCLCTIFRQPWTIRGADTVRRYIHFQNIESAISDIRD